MKIKRHFLRVVKDPPSPLSAIAKLTCWRQGPLLPSPPTRVGLLGKLPPLLPEQMGGDKVSLWLHF